MLRELERALFFYWHFREYHIRTPAPVRTNKNKFKVDYNSGMISIYLYILFFKFFKK